MPDGSINPSTSSCRANDHDTSLPGSSPPAWKTTCTAYGSAGS
jgi:hypothetical protein